MNSSSKSASIDVYIFRRHKILFFSFLSDILVGLSGIRILSRFPCNANILKNSSNHSKTLYYIVELFILYLLSQLFKGLVDYFLSYSLRREKKINGLHRAQIFRR